MQPIRLAELCAKAIKQARRKKNRQASPTVDIVVTRPFPKGFPQGRLVDEALARWRFPARAMLQYLEGTGIVAVDWQNLTVREV